MVIAAAAVLAGCDTRADLRIDLECPSPDGGAVATFYDLSGGGAAGWVQEFVAVHAAAAALDTAAHVFKLSHGYHVRLTWESGRRLTVGYPASGRVDTALAVARLGAGREVALRYVALPDSMGSLAPHVAGCVRGSAPPPPPAPQPSP